MDPVPSFANFYPDSIHRQRGIYNSEYMETRFTWDASKAEKNLLRRGISFEAATEVFSDPNQVTLENYFVEDQGEQRYGIIGLTRGLILLLVVYVDRSEAETETIHIISARKAERYETRIYTTHS
jgi:uncharacterized DUF497 family protein